MEDYIGTKIIGAERAQKHTCTTADCPEGVEGYKVVYSNPDGSTYESWSPKDVFEATYRSSGNLSFGHAIEYLKLGHKVARSGWNGKGMFLVLQTSTPEIKPYHGSCYANALQGIKETVTIDAHIDMYTAQGTFQPGWLASQADMLSNDWQIIQEGNL